MLIEKWLTPTATRRRFLIGAGLILSGTPVLFTNGCSESNNQAPREPTTADLLKAKEAEIGQHLITVEKAQELIGLLSRLYCESTNSQEKSAETQTHSFIVRGNLTTSEPPVKDGVLKLDVLKNLDGIKKLQQDYPGINLTDNEIAQLWGFSTLGLGLGLTYIPTNRLYLFLENINRYNKVAILYKESSSQIKCELSTPFYNFTSVYLHEATHRDAKDLPPPKELTDAIIKRTNNKHSPQRQLGFTISVFDTDKRVESSDINFEEILADYVARKILLSHGFPFITTSYTGPIDLVNFQAILEATSITDEQLIDLHRNGSFLEFLNAIGAAANMSPQMTAQTNPIETAIKIADVLSKRPIDWTSLKVYFPNIDDTPYFYTGLELQRGQDFSKFVPGCIAP